MTAPPGGGDVTAELQTLLDRGPGMVGLGPGEYRCAGLRIPSGVVLCGQGPATVLCRGDGPCVVAQTEVGSWGLRDLAIDGGAAGEWAAREDHGEAGLRVHRCWGYEVTGVAVHSVRGAGIEVAATPLTSGRAPFCNGGNLDRVTVQGCHAGVRFGERGEYLNVTALSAYENVTGVVIHAGNVKLAASNVCSNTDGIVIADRENGSHGAIANCLVNHNRRHALWCCGVRSGMTVSNCCFFYGDIVIEDSTGVTIAASEICCNLHTVGGGANAVTGNYVIPHPGICERFDIGSTTRLTGNYTADGPWRPPRTARRGGVSRGRRTK
jgi:hypothetical protein